MPTTQIVIGMPQLSISQTVVQAKIPGTLEKGTFGEMSIGDYNDGRSLIRDPFMLRPALWRC